MGSYVLIGDEVCISFLCRLQWYVDPLTESVAMTVDYRLSSGLINDKTGCVSARCPFVRTTLVLKNLPRHFDKEALKSLLEKLGRPFGGCNPRGSKGIQGDPRERRRPMCRESHS